MNDFENVSQWAILPARVRYDPDIPPNAKLLFAEIAAKTNLYGYCFASNRWFSERLSLSADHISALIKTLEAAEYISVDIDAARANVERRKIYITPMAFSFMVGIGKNPDTRIGENPETGTGKNPDTLKCNNKKEKIYSFGSVKMSLPRYMQLPIFAAIGEYCENEGDLMLAYIGWAEMRNKIHKPIASVETVRRANKKLDKLSGGMKAYKIGMLHKATDRSWTGLFALQPGDEGYPEERNAYTDGRRDLEWI